MKNLGLQLCGMDAEEVNDEALMNNKKMKIEPMARKVNQHQDDVGAAGPTGRKVE